MPQAFIAKWRKTTLKESAAANEHFLDLCLLAGPAHAGGGRCRGRRLTFKYNAALARDNPLCFFWHHSLK
jgi:hypothetical protein